MAVALTTRRFTVEEYYWMAREAQIAEPHAATGRGSLLAPAAERDRSPHQRRLKSPGGGGAPEL